jgi:hypothetical protein
VYGIAGTIATVAGRVGAAGFPGAHRARSGPWRPPSSNLFAGRVVSTPPLDASAGADGIDRMAVDVGGYSA